MIKRFIAMLLVSVMLMALAACGAHESATTNKATTAYEDSDGNYIGNINTHKFHRPSCSFLPDSQNRVYFDTWEEAIDAGYEGCQKCNP